jgi:hypothetical protein
MRAANLNSGCTITTTFGHILPWLIARLRCLQPYAAVQTSATKPSWKMSSICNILSALLLPVNLANIPI